MKQENNDADGLTSKADAAFRQAAAKVLERARRTGTPIVIWKDGRVVEIPSDQIELPPKQEQDESRDR